MRTAVLFGGVFSVRKEFQPRSDHRRSQHRPYSDYRHLIDKTPVSTVCDEAKIKPTAFYRWLKQLFENGATVLERANAATGDRPDLQAARRIAHLEDRLRTRDHVLAELMEEHVALKKSRGER